MTDDRKLPWNTDVVLEPVKPVGTPLGLEESEDPVTAVGLEDSEDPVTEVGLEWPKPPPVTAMGLEPVKSLSDTAAVLEPVKSQSDTAVGLDPAKSQSDSSPIQVPLGVEPVTATVIHPIIAARNVKAAGRRSIPLIAAVVFFVFGAALFFLDRGAELPEGAATSAELSVTSTPKGATVLLDGRPLPTRTPVTVKDLPTDRPHVVAVDLGGHIRWTKKLKLTPGTLNSLHAVLQPIR